MTVEEKNRSPGTVPEPADRVIHCDVVVVGSGGAGAAAAHTAATRGARVVVVSKDPLACSDSKISEGIVAVRGSGSARDTVEALAANMRVAGSQLSDPDLVRTFAEDSPDAYRWLCDQGLRPRLDPTTDRPAVLPLPLGGHDRARSIAHANGGRDYGHAAWAAVSQTRDIEYLEDTWFLDVVLASGQSPDASRRASRRVIGGLGYQATSGAFVLLAAKAVVLACGGMSTLYFPNTDTMRGNTGDAYAIALRAGAQLVDMEQIQFIPFALTYPPSLEGMLVGEPASAGPLGVLRDRDGAIIASELMVRTRAELSAIIARAVADGRGTARGGCYLDLTENARGRAGAMFVDMMRANIPGLLKTVRKGLGAKAAQFREPWEVRPSAHYCMGGVRTTAEGLALAAEETPILGLYAAGQALGGLHGSNRLGSTSLAEGAIFGRRAGSAAAAHAADTADTAERELVAAAEALLHRYRNLFGRRGRHYPIALMRRLQASAWRSIGPARHDHGLRAGWDEIDAVERDLGAVEIAPERRWNQGFIDCVELGNLITVARAVTLAAMERGTSIGAHVRLDAEARPAQAAPSSLLVSRDDRGVMRVAHLPRSSDARLAALRVRAIQAGKARFLWVLRHLPRAWRDVLLVRVYQRIQSGPKSPRCATPAAPAGYPNRFSAQFARGGSPMRVILCRHDGQSFAEHEYELPWSHSDVRPTALDALLAAQHQRFFDLAYRYGCRNEMCGVCTIEINGKPRLACRTKLRDGDRLAPLSTLPVVRDYVVQRDGINRQLLRRLPQVDAAQPGQSSPSAAYESLGRCIECYACLSGCPLHRENFADPQGADGDTGYRYGNPYSLLRIQRVRLDPATTAAEQQQALDLARDLGLTTCATCRRCTCQVGIDLPREVIGPLLEATESAG